MDVIILIVILIAWLTGTIMTFKYVGYTLNRAVTNGFLHDFQSFCDVCRLRGMHAQVIFWSSLVSVSIWPVIVLCWGISQALRVMGLSSDGFFSEPPTIKTKKERSEARMADLTRSIAVLEAENERLDREYKNKTTRSFR